MIDRLCRQRQARAQSPHLGDVRRDPIGQDHCVGNRKVAPLPLEPRCPPRYAGLFHREPASRVRAFTPTLLVPPLLNRRGNDTFKDFMPIATACGLRIVMVGHQPCGRR